MHIDDKSRFRDLYAHPVGRDLVDMIFKEQDYSLKYVQDPVMQNIRLETLRKWTEPHWGDDFWPHIYWLLNSHLETSSEGNPDPSFPWWKEAVFYQIFPRSFADSNGDGIGDLNGVYSKLDYLESLGVDAIWLSPVYDSPNEDNGYDVRDYRKIAEEMGTMEDFDRLLEAVHSRGMKLIMDLVLNHTSDEHEWFQEALKDPEGKYGTYYFFRDGDEDTPPNNWQSFFSGPAWKWLPDQEKWALKLFSDKQKDLNWDNPDVRKEMEDIAKFWHEKGVDGFRLDVTTYISKREGLPDGNEKLGELLGVTGTENFFFGPHIHDFFREMRKEAFDPYDAFSIGETADVGLEMGRLLTGEDRKELDLNFDFNHMETPGHSPYEAYEYDLNYLKAHYIQYHSRLTDNDWMTIFWDNHDNPRMISKVDPEHSHRDRMAKMLLLLKFTMRGTPFLYQGQEQGEINQPFESIEDLQDVESINYYQENKDDLGEDMAWRNTLAGARDHSRVPMNWDTGPHYGFSEVTPWLERPVEDKGWSIREQEEQEDSVLHFTRTLSRLRREHKELRIGTITFHEEDRKDYFAYTRELEGKRLFIELNLSDKPVQRKAHGKTLILSNITEPSADKDSLEPYEAAICQG